MINVTSELYGVMLVVFLFLMWVIKLLVYDLEIYKPTKEEKPDFTKIIGVSEVITHTEEHLVFTN